MAEQIVEVERRLSAPPDEVYGFLTDGTRYSMWMGRAAELDPRPGGIYKVEMSDDMAAVGEYIEVVPGARIVFTFGWLGDEELPPGSTTVEIVLAPDGDGTLLRLTHRGLPDAARRALHREGWERYLGQLVLAADGP